MPTEIAQKFFCQKEIQLGLFFDGTGNNKLFKQCSEVVFII